MGDENKRNEPRLTWVTRPSREVWVTSRHCMFIESSASTSDARTIEPSVNSTVTWGAGERGRGWVSRS